MNHTSDDPPADSDSSAEELAAALDEAINAQQAGRPLGWMLRRLLTTLLGLGCCWMTLLGPAIGSIHLRWTR